MSKEEFLFELRAALAGMQVEELENAMAYYEEYFAEAGPEREAEVIQELGTPQKLAAQLRVDIALRKMEQSPPTARKGISAVWIILLAIFAAPMAFPLALVIIILVFVLFVVLFSLVVALFATLAALLAAGIAVTLASFPVFFESFFGGLTLLGSGLAITGGALLVLVLMVLCTRWGFHAIARLLNSIRRKKEGKSI